MKKCVWCHSPIEDDEAVCRYCLTPQTGATLFQVGDRLRIRNPYKGMHVENVTVVAIARQGSALEIRDDVGRLWGCIHPKDVLGPAVTDRTA